jgi:hypothetical protein
MCKVLPLGIEGGILSRETKSKAFQMGQAELENFREGPSDR